MRKYFLFLILLFSFSVAIYSQENGKLQIHFIDVGQGDATLLISPKGETVLFDNGVANHCSYPIDYLDQLGIKKIDYWIISHYHDDHIGCSKEIISKFPLVKTSFDRGFSVETTPYEKYINAIGSHRKTAQIGKKVTLDSLSRYPVYIEFVAMNGAGIKTSNENDLSLVSLIHFGKLDVLMGGDLSGYNEGGYKDIESQITNDVGQVEVYKVHHHGSHCSSNEDFLSKIKPKVGIISASGTIGRNHYHPTDECLERLHNAKIKTYWTEVGLGAKPDPLWDLVSNFILVEAQPDSSFFTVTCSGSRVDSYPLWEILSSSENINEISSTKQMYMWSKNSNIYHYPNCKYVQTIDLSNLQKGTIPPSDKKLHEGCPK